MGWYGIFIVKKLKLACSLRSVSQDSLFSSFDSLERFFERYDKLREGIEDIQEATEGEKQFSAKTTARMFNVIDTLDSLPECSDAVFLLYFLHRFECEIEYHSEDEINLEKLEKKGWKVIRIG
jgi:hypothetical protein